MNRNLFYFGLTGIVTGAISSCANDKKAVDLSHIDISFKPNILWISCEDISPYLALYGDSTVHTPNIVRLAKEGIVFERCYASTGQSAPSRHSIITGMHSTATSGSNMRTGGKQFPDEIKCFPIYLMDVGYYCTNNVKTDYNFSEPKHSSIWNDCSVTAHWKNRPVGKPFFAVFNRTETHESQFRHTKPLRVDPAKVPIPPYYPDIEVVRKDLAKNYSNIWELDSIIGDYLTELEKNNLLDSTIIVFWSDHGGPLPRMKREVLTSGTHVPMIVRLPNKQYAGTRVSDLVSLVDLGPTMLSITGIPIPENMHGKPFMGKGKVSAQPYVYGGRDRIAGMLDMVRYVQSDSFLYIRNYYPEMPHWFRAGYRIDKIPMMAEILRLRDNGLLNDLQMQWFVPSKEIEELYDTRIDKHSMKNLAFHPAYKNVLEQMRMAHFQWMQETKDIGIFPELMQSIMEKEYHKTMYEIVREEKVPIVQIVENALLWKSGRKSIPALSLLINDSLAQNRYLAALGLGNIAIDTLQVKSKLMNALEDKNRCVQIAAAYALFRIGEKIKSKWILEQALTDGMNDEETGTLALAMLRRLKADAIVFEKLIAELYVKANKNIEKSSSSKNNYYDELDNMNYYLKQK